MMQVSHAAQVVQGHLHGSDNVFSFVQTDSRESLNNGLFVAIKGDNFDGHDFVANAASAGATAALVERVVDAPIAQIQVEDTTKALGQLAKWWRAQFSMSVIGITGSNGKTTVTAMTASILRQCGACLSPAGSFDNHWGVPITLLRMRSEHDYAVIEMGMNHAGEIDYLSSIAKPDIALINNISGAHLEGLGSLDNIAKAKQEIFNGLVRGGTAVINLDEVYHQMWLDWLSKNRPDVRIFTFSACVKADLQLLELNLNGFSSHFTLQYGHETVAVTLSVPGEHNAKNALAAAACALLAGASLSDVAAGLKAYQAVNQRVQIKTGWKGCTVIDDSFNANPASLCAAIDLLCQQDAKYKKRIAVLGNMAELGDAAPGAHRDCGEYAAEKGVDKLFALQEQELQFAVHYADKCKEAQVYESLSLLLKDLEKMLDVDVLVLVKGSKSSKMFRVVQALTSQQNIERGQAC